MLNQPEQDDTFQELLNSKKTGAISQITDTDITNEATDPCALCKGRGKAKRSNNQRAIVTVQRRANTKQKVVSLSFDRAVELTSHKKENVLENDALKNVEMSENKQMQNKTNSGTDSDGKVSKTKVTKQTEHQDRGSERGNFGKPSSKEKEEVVSSNKDEVFSFETGDGDLPVPQARDDKQRIAPPPIRLRQAWASPTQVRQHATSSVTQSRATNTESKRDKSKLSKKSSTELPINKKYSEAEEVCETDSVDPNKFEKQPDLDKERSVGQVNGEANVSVFQSKQKRKKRIDLKIPQADDYAPTEKAVSQSKDNPKPKPFEHTKTDTKTGNESSKNVDKETATNTNTITETKSHGMGDAEIAPEKSKMENSPDDTKNSKPDNLMVNKKDKTKKNKKPRTSLFSWSPFRKKPFLKQKLHDNTLEDHTAKTASKGYIAKTSMADVMYMQGRVAISQTLTEMFAASHPEKVAGPHQDKTGQK